MFSQRQLCCFLIVSLAWTRSAEPQFFLWPFHKKPHTAQTAKAPKAQKPPRPSRPWKASSLIHTQARFIYAGKVLAPVDSATAVLYNTAGPTEQEDVDMMNSGRNGVQQAKRVCGTFIPGAGLTVGPGGDIYFDYVDSGNYWILVCAQVKFSGMAKPVWVSATVPVARSGFTMDNYPEYNVPEQVQIVLDPYATELKAKPEELPTRLAELEEPPIELKVPYNQPAPLTTSSTFTAAPVVAQAPKPASYNPPTAAAPVAAQPPRTKTAPPTPAAAAPMVVTQAPKTKAVPLQPAASPTVTQAPKPKPVTLVPAASPTVTQAPKPKPVTLQPAATPTVTLPPATKTVAPPPAASPTVAQPPQTPPAKAPQPAASPVVALPPTS